MEYEDLVNGLTPPLQLAWRKELPLAVAVPGTETLYGITPTGSVIALSGATGDQRWTSRYTYLPNRLISRGRRLFAYRLNEGFGYLEDNGTNVSEGIALSFGASPDVNACLPAIDGDMVYLAVNNAVYAWHQTNGLQAGAVLDDVQPYAIAVVQPGAFVTIDGRGVPTRYSITASGIQRMWTGVAHGIDAGQMERPFLLVGNRLIIALGFDTVAYDLSSGQIAWHLGIPAAAMCPGPNGLVFVLSHGATFRAISSTDGSVLWTRQYLYDMSLQMTFGLTYRAGHLFGGGNLRLNPDGAVLMALDSSDGNFRWLSRTAKASWAAGVPLDGIDYLYAYGSSHTGAYRRPARTPLVNVDNISVSPRPLRGQQTSFGPGSISLDLPVSSVVSISTFRESGGLGTRILSDASFGPGHHEVAWTASGAGGFSDRNQFGFMLVDIKENANPVYSHALLVPVNTFPDILSHWARTNIEIMVYHKYVGGYPDQTFRPDSLVSRAESATIIAKTLGLEGPSPGFTTRFTDIGNHWARNHIMALEESGVLGGFEEPDGTYTFRPDVSMTRAQEARILMRAYHIDEAPPAFRSRFSDIGGHWAEADIKSLEAAGYINGFAEPDGSFTYRPDQNLTRAELCTVVVRIRDLTR